MIVLLAFLFAVSFLVTADLVPWVVRLAWRRGFLDFPGPRKIHAEPVAYGGGLAVAAGVLLTLFGGVLAAHLHVRHGWFASLPETAAIAARAVPPRLPLLLVYALGSLVILVLGLADDRHKLSAGRKLAVEAVVAVGVALGGERLDLFGMGPIPGVILTALWILAVTNAFNLLDHMDGLSSGVALIAGLGFLAVAFQTEQFLIAPAAACLIGACAGFLLFNFPPARIFLGDAGSLFIGFWMASLTVSFTFYSALGMSPRLAVLTVYALTLCTALSAILLYHVRESSGALIVLAQLLLTFGIITLLEAAGRARERRGP